MDLGLTGRVALITGPAKGMGAAVTLAFAREGCRLALLGRDIAAIEPIAAQVRAFGTEAIVVTCDVTVPAQCDAAVAATHKAFGGRTDVLVNVAGGTGPVGKTGLETTAIELNEIIDLNTTGCFNMIRAVLPTMIAQRFGKVINVGGTFGMRGRAGRLGYSASKWALRGVTKSFALEVGADNINVNCVAPGMVDGPRFREKVSADLARRLGITRDEAAGRLAEEYALKRISTAEDVANACLFLGSDVSRQITGVDLPVDGGWAML
jgi:NAD(P)-dependent dehydrogenase (short-subunit alcohol dehydrogenase family)